MDSIKYVLIILLCLLSFIIYVVEENIRVTFNVCINKKILFKKISMKNFFILFIIIIIIVCSFVLLIDARDKVIYYNKYLLNPIIDDNEIDNNELQNTL